VSALNRIRLTHGSGAGLKRLLEELVLPALGIGGTEPLEDAAVLPYPQGRVAFTTDSFVVNPLVFPGGDIGKLAACGTINDLASMGARPRHMAVSLILEEGLEAELLTRLLHSLRRTCDEAGVGVVCGDTKVVDRGKADRVFITTSGIGVVPPGRSLSAGGARAGDVVVVSGPIGRHGVAILAQRKNLGFASTAVSDCAPLHEAVEALLGAIPQTRVIRDATRGGCAAVLNEIGADSGVTIRIRKADVPVPEVVAGACSFLGLDPLQVANEGTLVAVVPGDKGTEAVEALRSSAVGREAALIGRVFARQRFPVLLETEIGGTRPVEIPPGELLPRIC
jgi:hydrogenase expression/formation protein HypE